MEVEDAHYEVLGRAPPYKGKERFVIKWDEEMTGCWSPAASSRCLDSNRKRRNREEALRAVKQWKKENPREKRFYCLYEDHKGSRLTVDMTPKEPSSFCRPCRVTYRRLLRGDPALAALIEELKEQIEYWEARLQSSLQNEEELKLTIAEYERLNERLQAELERRGLR